jgi:hypothetical protein
MFYLDKSQVLLLNNVVTQKRCFICMSCIVCNEIADYGWRVGKDLEEGGNDLSLQLSRETDENYK